MLSVLYSSIFRGNGGGCVVCVVLLYIQGSLMRLCCLRCTPLYSGVTEEVVLSALYSSGCFWSKAVELEQVNYWIKYSYSLFVAFLRDKLLFSKHSFCVFRISRRNI